MKRKRFTEEQIVQVLKEAEPGTVPITEICRQHGISEYSFYRWRRKYQGLTVSEAKRYRQLERENARLKPLVANRDREIDAMKALLRKNG